VGRPANKRPLAPEAGRQVQDPSIRSHIPRSQIRKPRCVNMYSSIMLICLSYHSMYSAMWITQLLPPAVRLTHQVPVRFKTPSKIVSRLRSYPAFPYPLHLRHSLKRLIMSLFSSLTSTHHLKRTLLAYSRLQLHPMQALAPFPMNPPLCLSIMLTRHPR
jgi:hypothetical protein